MADFDADKHLAAAFWPHFEAAFSMFEDDWHLLEVQQLEVDQLDHLYADFLKLEAAFWPHFEAAFDFDQDGDQHLNVEH